MVEIQFISSLRSYTHNIIWNTIEYNLVRKQKLSYEPQTISNK